MTDTDKDPQQTIEQCFEEIKNVLKKYKCEIDTLDGDDIFLWANNQVCIRYKLDKFNK